MTCPACGSSVTATTNHVAKAPVLMPVRDEHGACRRMPAVPVRPLALMTWAGCDACEWCGPVGLAKAVA